MIDPTCLSFERPVSRRVHELANERIKDAIKAGMVLGGMLVIAFLLIPWALAATTWGMGGSIERLASMVGVNAQGALSEFVWPVLTASALALVAAPFALIFGGAADIERKGSLAHAITEARFPSLRMDGFTGLIGVGVFLGVSAVSLALAGFVFG